MTVTKFAEMWPEIYRDLRRAILPEGIGWWLNTVEPSLGCTPAQALASGEGAIAVHAIVADYLDPSFR